MRKIILLMIIFSFPSVFSLAQVIHSYNGELVEESNPIKIS